MAIHVEDPTKAGHAACGQTNVLFVTRAEFRHVAAADKCPDCTKCAQGFDELDAIIASAGIPPMQQPPPTTKH